MNSSYGQCSLFLCPGQHDFSHSNISSLVSALQEIDFISAQINPQEKGHHYSVGEKYLDYIAYMGCSPAIQFESSETNDHYCHIKIHRFQSAQLIHSKKQTRIPLCPKCKKPLTDLFKNKAVATVLCNHCHHRSSLEEFNWRKMAGYARLFIEITDIFPKEAIPQQLLMDKLASISGTDWQYFYSCH